MRSQLIWTALIYPAGGGNVAKSVLSWESGVVKISGTWTIVGDEQANPEQTSDIECHLSNKTCLENSATVSRNRGGPFLIAAFHFLKIDRWDDHEIVATHDLTCVRYTTVIRRREKTVRGTRSLISERPECQATSATLDLLLVDDLEIRRQLDERQNRAADLMKIDAALLNKE